MVKFKNFLITEDNGKFNFQNLKTGQQKPGVKITYDKNYIYKCQKAQIKTRYTAREIMDLFQKGISGKSMSKIIVDICSFYVGEFDYDFKEE